MNCILCEDNGFKKVLKVKDGYCIVKCPCGLVYVNSPDSQTAISDQYKNNKTSPSNYYEETACVDQINFNRRLNILEALTIKGKLLDVGCSVGTFMFFAERRGWVVKGIEPNAKSARIALSHHLTVDNNFLNETPFIYNIDVVTLNDVIEHFPNPLESLQIIRGMLKENGLVAISTPNIDSILTRIFQIKPREHLFYFNKQMITKLLEKAGFEILFCETTGRRRAIDKMSNGATLSKQWKILSKILSFTKLHLLVSIFLDRFFKDEIFVVARKDRN
jgi:2-polyprenyl-3-methyl-5-hydroxy-6-metoxy-1,4-benzoquinol methylase